MFMLEELEEISFMSVLVGVELIGWRQRFMNAICSEGLEGFQLVRAG